MMEPTKEPPVNWRFVYGAVLAWLVAMVVLMRLFTQITS